MNFRSILAAGALAAASSAAFALPGPIVFDAGGNASFNNTTAGSPTFLDVFTFSVPDFADLIAGSVTTTFLGAKDVDIASIAISSTAGPTYNFVQASTDPFEQWTLSGVTLFANVAYSLTVIGSQGGTAAGGYSGELSVTAVPEPQTYALLLAGLGVMGFVARRRRPQ